MRWEWRGGSEGGRVGVKGMRWEWREITVKLVTIIRYDMILPLHIFTATIFLSDSPSTMP